MKNLLYITVNSKPESISASKQVGRTLVEGIKAKYEEYTVEEVDLYKDHIPRLEYPYFESRNCIVNKEAFEQLNPEQQKEVKRIIQLCEQFKKADVYVIAAPMWSLSFPAPLKEYLDCVIQVNKTITLPSSNKKPEGLLNDKPRTAIYVQSSGGQIPLITRPFLNKGLDYVKDIFKFMGIGHFHEILVDGTGTTETEVADAIKKGKERCKKLLDEI